ncbi:type VII secretion protein EccB [Streptomyces sp. NBC_00385]|uniref:type VII secretion protein EccB n=1 Tax=Streptomyces sp. NBC_00385 TaxID=2975733 RepID=UPI002DDB3D28|nr:type VII secretion protein EccB [Streptomyces sp. NBC_00385]WRZ03313.1 type VII secretion protein EccB [Streptomyces sp. NBC_00385]
MASRRDDLNAYTFAKRRMVAAFLQPSPTGSDEGAPRPLRAVLPGLVAGALIVAGFGAYGMFRPAAPKDWDSPGTKVIVGKSSTTRYVVLTTGRGADRETLLHPVLNLASARLLLTPQNYGVIQVDDDILDAGKPPRGPVLGIPYAPDRLPETEDAGTAKRWAVCVQPGSRGTSVQKAAFVLAARDDALTEGAGRLTGGQVLYVRGQDRTRYLVDARGTKYRIDETPADLGHLTGALVGSAQPQPVTDDWLATLHEGSPVAFPRIPGTVGAPAHIEGHLSAQENRVGTVLRTRNGEGTAYYVVLDGEVRPVSEFTAWLIVNSPQTAPLDLAGEARPAGLQDFVPGSEPFAGQAAHWPAHRAVRVNATDAGAAGRDTVCNVLRRTDGTGRTTLSTWAGTAFPASVGAGGTSTYVTPGSGLLYTQVREGQGSPDGSLFLVTDTGLRYAVQANGDSDAERSGIGTGGAQDGQEERPEPSQAQIRLGYGKVTPVPVPIAWSEFLARGPRLDTNSARRPQGS